MSKDRLSSPCISCRSQISQLHWVLMTARSNASTYDKMSLSICSGPEQRQAAVSSKMKFMLVVQ